MEPLVLGTTATYARSLVRAHRGVAIGALLTAVGVFLLGLAVHLVLLGLLGAAGLVIYARTRLVAASRASAGVRSEERVATVLARQPVGAVAHGFMLGAGGDCDHVVVGPALIAVETKTGHGTVTARDGAVFAGNHQLPRDPIAQVRRQATALHRLSGHHASAVLCVVDMANAPFRAGDVVVCSLADLPRVVVGCPSAGFDTRRARQFLGMLNDRQSELAARRAR